MMNEMKVGSAFHDHAQFRQLVGNLMPLSNTVRPDVGYAVNYPARYMHKPMKTMWFSGKHILRYLSGTARFGPRFKSGRALKMLAYSDSDWDEERPTRKLVSSYIFMLAAGPISSCSKRQSVVAQSSAKEAEFVAFSMCIWELR